MNGCEPLLTELKLSDYFEAMVVLAKSVFPNRLA